jgi:zinc transport system permease protein
MADAPPPPGVGSDELAELAAALDPSAAAPAAPIAGAGGGPTWSDFADGWELFRDAVYAAGIAGAVLGFLSVYVVLRRMVFVSAAITQGAGLGVALAFFVGIRLGWSVGPSTGATVLSLAIAAIAARDWQRIRLSREMVLGLLFAMTSGLAVVVGSRITQEAHDIHAILFGAAVVVAPEDLTALAAIAAGVMALQVWWYRGFAFASFDPLTARVHGVPVGLLDLVLLVSIALVVARVASTLGALPAFALSTMPGVAAALISRGPLVVTFALAAVLGAAAGVGGYLIAFFGELPVGATQTVTATAAAVLAAALRGAVHLVSSSSRRGAPPPGPARPP